MLSQVFRKHFIVIDMDHRVKFNQAPLIETIFQIQFPEILSISSNPPAVFQEMIRGDFPLFTQKATTNALPKAGGYPKISSVVKNYEFVNSEGYLKINLSNTFVAVSTLRYNRWEEFKSTCLDIVQKVNNVYNTNVIQRVGLRYKDLIVRSKWGMQERKWRDLIKSEYLGALAEEDESLIPRYVLDYEKMNPNGAVTHNHRELVMQLSTMEKSMLIDNDYYRIGIFKPEHIDGVAEQLHDLSSAFIQSVFTELLETAMEPVEL